MPTPTTIADDLSDPQNNAVESALRAAARPVEVAPFPSDDRASKYIVAPDSWTPHEVKAIEPPKAPRSQTGDYHAYTAEGFTKLVESVGGKIPSAVGDPTNYRLLAFKDEIKALIDPGSLDSPSFEKLAVHYRPAVSDELQEWIDASKPHSLQGWETFVEDHQLDIDAAEGTPGYVSGLNVLGDARNWNVEARSVMRRIKSDNGQDIDAAHELKVKTIGSALGSFRIQLPILRFGEPLPLLVLLTRDLDNMTIAPRIPGIKRLTVQACEREFVRVEDFLGAAIR